MRILDDIFSLRVPNLYKLQLSLPVAVEHEESLSFFDCKLRRMIVVAPVQEPKIVEIVDDTPAPVAETESRPIAVDEEEKNIDREESKETTNIAPSATDNADDDDLLFDVVWWMNQQNTILWISFTLNLLIKQPIYQ